MIKLERILFATDFSPHADEARHYACEFVERFGAELHLLHVVPDLSVQVPDFGMGLAFPSFTDNLSEQRDQAEQHAISMLSRQLEPAWQQNQRVILATRFGPPFVEIVRYAREHFVDLIVMATHGRTGLSHVLIGSVAERVVRKADCPVLTVRPKQFAEELDPAAAKLRPAPEG